ncbi:MAG: metal ABC transporter permease [Verrucomicrobiota bacterium]|nr:metal ABC transporter permease [Verrucomicrobiota bacterium]
MEMLQYEFMRNALMAGLLVSIACGVIGALVVVNRVVFISAGIAHAAYGGVGLGYFLNFNPFLGALVFSVGSALGMGVVQRRARQRSDTLIGVLWAVGMSLGILLVDMTDGYKADLMSYLFGSILTVPRQDLWIMLALDIVILLVVVVAYRELLGMSFDETFASVRNIPVETLHKIVLTLIAVTVVMLMRVVGLILVIALLTIPAAIASLFLNDLSKIMVGAVAIGLLFLTSGLIVSYQFNLTSGATIILLAGCGYFLAFTAKQLLDRHLRGRTRDSDL